MSSDDPVDGNGFDFNQELISTYRDAKEAGQLQTQAKMLELWAKVHGAQEKGKEGPSASDSVRRAHEKLNGGS